METLLEFTKKHTNITSVLLLLKLCNFNNCEKTPNSVEGYSTKSGHCEKCQGHEGQRLRIAMTRGA